jgi:hypothetical protein
MIGGYCAFPKSLSHDVGCCDGILDGKINSNAADGRHSVSCVADTQKARAIPLPQAIDTHGQQLDVAPVAQLADPVCQEGRDFRDARSTSMPLR